MHKKISKGLVEHKTGKPKVRSPRSTARDSKKEEATSSAVSANVITAARGSVAVEMKSKQRQTKQKQVTFAKDTEVQASPKETKEKQKKITKTRDVERGGPMTQERACAAASSKLKAQSKIKMLSEQAARKKQREQKAVPPKARPQQAPRKLVKDDSRSSSKYYYSSSEYYYDEESDDKSEAPRPDEPVHASPKCEGRGRSETSSREHFRREPPRARSRSRSRSEHRRRGHDHRDVVSRERQRSVSPRSSGQRSTTHQSRQACLATSPPVKRAIRTPPRQRSPTQPRVRFAQPPHSPPPFRLLRHQPALEPPAGEEMHSTEDDEEKWRRSWVCEKCKTRNVRHLLNCKHCLGHRAMWDRNMEHKPRHDDWICEHCTNINFAYRKECAWADCPSKDWTCRCGNVNFARRKLCNSHHCGRHRPW